MGFLTGGVKTTGGDPNLEKELGAYLRSQGYGSLFEDPTAAGVRAPYEELFALQNREAGAAGKEAAGNLTGSGFANILGRRLNDVNAQQSAFLANILNQKETSNRDRHASLIAALMGQDQSYYQEGVLDSIFKGAGAFGAAATGLGSLKGGT